MSFAGALYHWRIDAHQSAYDGTSVSAQPDEAVAAAIAEFESQGVDLSNVIKSPAGGDVSTHPLAQGIAHIQESIQRNELQGAETFLDEIYLIFEDKAIDRQSLGAVVHATSLVVTLEQCLVPAFSLDARRTILRILAQALPLSSDIRSRFRSIGGPVAVLATLKDAAAQGRYDVMAAALRAATALSAKDEDGKCSLMDVGLGVYAGLLLAELKPEGAHVAVEACMLLSSLTTADDDTVPSSRQGSLDCMN